MTVYYFAAASKCFLIEEEPVEEILRERLSYYHHNNIPVDFWLTFDPKFFEIRELSSIKKIIKRDLAAVVSTNAKFIDWLQLRLQYVATGNFSSNKNKTLVQNLISDTIKL